MKTNLGSIEVVKWLEDKCAHVARKPSERQIWLKIRASHHLVQSAIRVYLRYTIRYLDTLSECICKC